jgi:dipeptidyl aminopeptidase/acylaminoacyl peptidase
MRRLALGLMCIAMFTVGGAGSGQESVASPEKTNEKKPLTPEAFLELRQVQDPRFSPDGTRVAFVVSDPYKNDKRTVHIWLYDTNTRSCRQLTYSDKSDSMPRWSPDSKKLAFLSNRGGDYQQLYVLRMEGGEGVALTSAKANVSALAWAPDGKSIAYISPDPKTDEEEKKEKDKDDAHVVDKEDKQPRLRIIDLKSKQDRVLTEPTWAVSDLAWLRDGQNIVVSATNRPASDQETHRIYSVNLNDPKMKELAAPRGPIANLQVSDNGPLISFTGCREDGPQPHDLMLLPPMGGVPRNLTGASLDRQIIDYKWMKDGGLFLTYVDGFKGRFVQYAPEGERKDVGDLPVNAEQFSLAPSGAAAFIGETTTLPQELWVRERDGSAHQASHVNDPWKPYVVIAPEFYKYKSKDNLEIEAALLKPAGYDGKSKLPTVVLIHGGPTGGWEDRIDAWGQLLVTRGYLVMYPNIRGSIGYGQKFVELNRADWGGGDFQDVEKGVDDLVAKGFADPDRLGIGGWSYGGYMSEWAITQTTRYKAAVSGAGMANLISEYGTEQHPSYDEWFYGVPYEKPEGFLNGSPFLFVKNAKTPTLILQGQADPIDPLGQSQELYRGLKRYGVASDFVQYPREPHGFQEPKHRVDVTKRMIAWFDKYLKNENTKPAEKPPAEHSSR